MRGECDISRCPYGFCHEQSPGQGHLSRSRDDKRRCGWVVLVLLGMLDERLEDRVGDDRRSPQEVMIHLWAIRRCKLGEVSSRISSCQEKLCRILHFDISHLGLTVLISFEAFSNDSSVKVVRRKTIWALTITAVPP